MLTLCLALVYKNRVLEQYIKGTLNYKSLMHFYGSSCSNFIIVT